ncbi:MAG: two-component response regulator [Alphaproteobacteria bacterium]|jgi:CheY-like chemotaxis protein|nr:two-component response regulator [Alphaproteobacteria bacterium]
MSEPLIENAAKRLKILVIEDDTLTRTSLCRILGNLNYETHGACNGFEGLKLFRQIHPDLVVTDLLMPDKEGLSTITEMRTISPGTPIIAMSSGGPQKDMGFLDLAATFGASRTLVKPFTPRQILELMQDIQKEGA